jgi:DNA replication and repair protein RecF
LEPGLVLVIGQNGAGKTNLLEALHVGSQGFSPRTRAEPRLVRLGDESARVSLSGSEAGSPVETEVTIVPREGKRVRLNGSAVASGEVLRTRLAALVFTPDRLAVVKGGPLVRRTYFDRMLGRALPAQASLPSEYGRVLAQRNEALRRARAGTSTPDAVEPWTRQLAKLGSELDAARGRLVSMLAPRFEEYGSALGLAPASLAYEERGLAAAELEARLPRDLERGTTGAGPHLSDVEVRADGRELRGFGSQGEQRLGVLALLLAEAALLTERRGSPPLLLLDDVFSELDRDRRSALLGLFPAGGQAVLTSTGASVLPADARPSLVVEVRRERDVSLAEAG